MLKMLINFLNEIQISPIKKKQKTKNRNGKKKCITSTYQMENIQVFEQTFYEMIIFLIKTGM